MHRYLTVSCESCDLMALPDRFCFRFSRKGCTLKNLFYCLLIQTFEAKLLMLALAESGY